MKSTHHMTTTGHSTTRPVAQQRMGQDWRSYRTIFAATFVLCLATMPMRRAMSWPKGRDSYRRVSMLAQAQAEASIVASYALMGY